MGEWVGEEEREREMEGVEEEKVERGGQVKSAWFGASGEVALCQPSRSGDPKWRLHYTPRLRLGENNSRAPSGGSPPRAEAYPGLMQGRGVRAQRSAQSLPSLGVYACRWRVEGPDITVWSAQSAGRRTETRQLSLVCKSEVAMLASAEIIGSTCPSHFQWAQRKVWVFVDRPIFST